ncbi:unnamed protein product [Peronospora farinosa]|uniref:Uncharacterized protein n=1 Tax=Peronospora farinosa TaxID=134698 RepID=A0AAV0U093_9STRA|nr:unnamed protein product [Peronospora farinosa]CAI5730226.1 unnamed protein product [Peronospora farinosa]
MATNLSWQETVANETDAAKKEWMALERRYQLKLIHEDATTLDKRILLFLSLSDPELPTRFKGQVELQMILPRKYPIAAAQVDFCQWNSRLSELQAKAINAAVTTRAQQLCGSFSLRKLLTWIDNNFWRIIAPFENNSDHDQDVIIDGCSQNRELEMSVVEAEVLAPIGKKSKRNRGQRLCHFFARGNCRDGEQCKFSHQKKSDTLKVGAACEDPDAVTMSALRDANPVLPVESSTPVTVLPERKKKARVRICKFYAQNKCRNGDSCKFSHEMKRAGTKGNGQNQTLESSPGAIIVQLDTLTGSAAGCKDSTSVTKVENDLAGCNTKNIESHREISSAWSEAQQRALDLALKKYPTSMDKEERWTSIANEVDGRSLNECIDRYKSLCEMIRRGVDPIATAQKVIEQEETAQLSENEELVYNSKIIPAEKRVTILTEPEVKGTSIRLEDLFLHEVGTLVAHRLICQIQCDNCPLKFDVILSLDSAEIQKWCPRCSVLHHVVMRPVFAHSMSNVLAYVDTKNCCIVDVLPTDVLATCLECGCEALLERIMPQQRSEQACFSCHVKLAVMAKRFIAGQSDGSTSKRNVLNDIVTKVANVSKKGAKPAAEVFVLGQPLPRNGTCEHYKHSQRWFRFQCCGKAFPCDVCHDSSDCPEANLGKFASRMICGLCSKEQSSAVKVCSCGNDVATKKSVSRHWEGGAGCRNSLHMSRLDKQKHRGQNKTESKKFKRVGAEAKKLRENETGNANAQQ